MTVAQKATTKERPVLFNSEMVRAILGGKKTQTRRVIKPQPESASYWTEFEGAFYPNTRAATPAGLVCPYGIPKDRLWVRETWQPMCEHEECYGANLRTGAGLYVNYRADGRGEETVPPDGGMDDAKVRWKPSIFMPRWACRLTLQVVSTRVERVQDISENDAEAEGCEMYDQKTMAKFAIPGARYRFERLWDHINSKRGFSWESNPWVWVVEFKRIES